VFSHAPPRMNRVVMWHTRIYHDLSLNGVAIIAALTFNVISFLRAQTRASVRSTRDPARCANLKDARPISFFSAGNNISKARKAVSLCWRLQTRIEFFCGILTSTLCSFAVSFVRPWKMEIPEEAQ